MVLKRVLPLVTAGKFPLDEQDLVFLSRFTIMQNGERQLLFRKGIEKYRLAQQRIAAGEDPLEVKQALEHATGAVHQGQRFSWPEADITLNRNIPVMEK